MARFTTNGKYDPIDSMELDIAMDIENGCGNDLLESFVKGKCSKNINKELLINTIKERVDQKDYLECIQIIKKNIGIVLTEEDLVA